jgi:hypothetical protein
MRRRPVTAGRRTNNIRPASWRTFAISEQAEPLVRDQSREPVLRQRQRMRARFVNPHARQPRQQPVDAECAQEGGEAQPRPANRLAEEEAVVAEPLIQRHQQHAIVGRTDRSVAVAREFFAVRDRVDVLEARLHDELTVGTDRVAIRHFDHAGSAASRVLQHTCPLGRGSESARAATHPSTRAGSKSPPRGAPACRDRDSARLRPRRRRGRARSRTRTTSPRSTPRARAATESATTTRRAGSSACRRRPRTAGPALEVECRSTSMNSEAECISGSISASNSRCSRCSDVSSAGSCAFTRSISAAAQRRLRSCVR